MNQIKDLFKTGVDLGLHFWNSILVKDNLNVLKKFGLDFSDLNYELNKEYESLSSIYENNEELIFYNKMYNNVMFGISVKDKVKKYQKDFQSEKYFQSKSAFVIANIVDCDKAIIEKITENIFTFLGYIPDDCLNHDVKILMPNFYKIRHSYYLKNHFKTGIKKILNKERLVFSQHLDNYNIATNITVKFLETVNNISYIGFLREIEISYEFLVVNKNGNVLFYSKKIYETLIKQLQNVNNSQELNYFQFFCREFFYEIESKNGEHYEIKPKINPNIDSQYFITHLGLHNKIVRYFKQEKKKNNNTFISSKRKIYDENEHLTPIQRLVKDIELIKAEMILGINTNNLQRYFCKFEEIDICDGETHYIIKLYNDLNFTDLNQEFNNEEKEKALLEFELKKIEKNKHKLDSILLSKKVKPTIKPELKEEKLNNKENYSQINENLKRMRTNVKISKMNVLENVINISDNKPDNNKTDKNNDINNKEINKKNEDSDSDSNSNDEKYNNKIVSNDNDEKFDFTAFLINKQETTNKMNFDIMKSISSNASLKCTVDRDDFKSLKKKFVESNSNSKIIETIILNFFFLIILIVISVIFYNNLYSNRITTLEVLNYDYFKILDITFYICVIKKNLKFVEFYYNVKQELNSFNSNKLKNINITEYLDSESSSINSNNESHNLMINTIDDRIKFYIEKLNLNKENLMNSYDLLTTKFDKSKQTEYLGHLSSKINLNEKTTYSYKYYLMQLIIIYENVLMPNNYDLSKISNSYEIELYKSLFNEDTINNINEQQTVFFTTFFSNILKQNDIKKPILIIVILIMSLSSLITFIRIIFMYKVQMHSISLLFGLNSHISKAILSSIKKVHKLFSIKSSKNDSEEQEEKIDDNKNEIVDMNLNNQKQNNEKDNDKLIQEDKIDQIDKIEIDIKMKYLKKNKAEIWIINWDIYIKLFIFLLILTILSIIPSILYLNNNKYEEVFKNYFDYLYITSSGKNYHSINNEYMISMFLTDDEIKKEELRKKFDNFTSNYKDLFSNMNENLYKLLYRGDEEALNISSFFSKEICTNYFQESTRDYILKDSNISIENQNKLINLLCSDSEKNLSQNKGIFMIKNIIDSKISFTIEDKTVNEADIEMILNDKSNEISINLKNKINSLILLNSFKVKENLEYIDLLEGYSFECLNFINVLLKDIIFEDFHNYFTTIFISSIILYCLYLIAILIIMWFYNKKIILESKKLFSLLPSIVVFNNEEILDLFINS